MESSLLVTAPVWAVLGEVCSHVGALVFAVDAAVQVRDSQTVTRVPAYWLLPSSMSKVEYSEMKVNILYSRQLIKRKLDSTLSCGTPQSYTLDQVQKFPEVAWTHKWRIDCVFRKKKPATKGNVVLFPMPKYAEHYVPSPLGEAYPDILTELYDGMVWWSIKRIITWTLYWKNSDYKCVWDSV